MENQLTSELELQSEASIQARLEETAVMNVARDIQELSFAQIGDEQDADSAAFEGIAAQLLELSKNQDLDTLRQCIYDVKNGIY